MATSIIKSVTSAARKAKDQPVTIWCGLWLGEVIEAYLFENEAGSKVTVTGLHYPEMTDDFL